MKVWIPIHNLLCPLLFILACGPTTKERSPRDRQTPPVENRDRGIAGMALEDLPQDQSPLSNLEEILHTHAIPTNSPSPNSPSPSLDRIKIAVLDNGFTGVNGALGTRLPPQTRLIADPTAYLGRTGGNTMQDTTHGTKLAEIAYAVATRRAAYVASAPGPQMLLINANGWTNLQAAIEIAVQEGVDIILYAQVWQYGGNFDGGGFINRAVERATRAGILWVNAAGNVGQASWHGPIRIQPDLAVALPYQDRYLRMTVPQNQTPVKIVLAWNDFADSADYKTKQDLDLILENLNGEEIAASRWLQRGELRPGDRRDSAHAREIIKATLDTGTYYLRVVAKSSNFDAFSRLRLSADGLGVRILEGAGDHSLLIPADNPEVLTIGALDASNSARNSREAKPELSVISRVRFAAGTEHRGTSAASAIAAGALAYYLDKKMPFQRNRREVIMAGIRSREIARHDVSDRSPQLFFNQGQN